MLNTKDYVAKVHDLI